MGGKRTRPRREASMATHDDRDDTLTGDVPEGLIGTDATAPVGPGVSAGAGDDALDTPRRAAAPGGAQLEHEANAAQRTETASAGASAGPGAPGGSAGTPGYGTAGE